MLALFEGFPQRLIAIIMRISTGFLVDGFCGIEDNDAFSRIES